MKFIVIGDIHLGIRAFNNNFLSNQLRFFHEQLFPYMLENGIDTIVQLGDFLDNRTMMNIETFDRLNIEFFEPLKRYGFKMITILGNHDIAFQTTLDINLVKYFGKLYPDNVTVVQENKMIKLGKTNYLFMPWLVKDKKIASSDLRGADVVFGHFEIRDFEMVKGHIDKVSELTPEVFRSVPGLKRVISGHYHVKSSDGFIDYIGTPFQLNWGDYKTARGFFVMDEHNYEFIENTTKSAITGFAYCIGNS